MQVTARNDRSVVLSGGAREPMRELNRVRIVESGEPLVDIREWCPSVTVLDKARPFLRRSVAEMLEAAATKIPAEFRLRLSTALRTIDDQRRHWDGYYARTRAEHPDWPVSALHRAVNRFFAPTDQPAPPGHCTGGAVDVHLLGPDGELLDMITPLTGWDAARTWHDGISDQARRNRMLMVDAMLSVGFSNCREEYWHYSYGDSAWAVRVGSVSCPYGLVWPPTHVH